MHAERPLLCYDGPMPMQQVREVVERAVYGFLATSRGGQPRVRPMSFILFDDGRLWSSTYRCSGKVAELVDNDRVEVCFLDDRKLHVRFEGRLRITGGESEKRRLLELNPKVRRHFPDEHDDNFVHLEVVPTRIRWKRMGFNEYEDVPVLPA